MSKTMNSWFFMRDGLGTFRLEPETHRQFLFGSKERRQRDYILDELEGAGFSGDGHKSVIYGEYGLGKTHMCRNLSFEIERRGMDIIPVYIKCSAYTSKEPFQSLFKEMVTGHAPSFVNNVATQYAQMVKANEATPLEDIVQSEQIGFVMTKGLTAVDLDAVRNSLRWLGGEAKVPMGLISHSLRPQLTDSREFGAVMRGLAHMFNTVERKVPLYLVDEAERFENVTHVDTFASWLAALRELTEIVHVGMMFFVGAKTRDRLPTIVVQDEIVRRIGVANYVEFHNPSRDQMRDFLVELFSTFVRKGEVPEAHRGLMDKTLDSTVPSELLEITQGNAERLKTFPFEPDAFEEFIEQVTAGDLTNKPSEVLIRLQKAAQRAMKKEQRVIDSAIVEQISTEGF
jgi:hypothetical protein